MKTRAAFTLIELLIVVAVIGILAAIAVPNFLNAQNRAKVSRCEADMRSLSMAIETYRLDNNQYHPDLGIYWATNFPLVQSSGALCIFYPLTTPVSYISTPPITPFGPWQSTGAPNVDFRGYDYEQVLITNLSQQGLLEARYEYALISAGPTRDFVTLGMSKNSIVGTVYNMTNGVVSAGNVVRYGPGGDAY
ncbi:MAG: prepilin-type N-terminal cleavage/methylation domain-containing protein [bacterium]